MARRCGLVRPALRHFAVVVFGLSGACGSMGPGEPIAAAEHCVLSGEDAPPDPARGLGRLVDDGAAVCSVTLVSSRWAVTAGHCVAGREPARLLAVFGDLLAEESELGEEWLTVRRVQSFPGWGTDTGVLIDDDLALIEFEQDTSAVPVEFGSAVGSCYGDVYGWGATSREQLGSDRLQSARLRVWDETTCATHLAALGEPQLSGRMLCAGAADGAPGACHGDSGGPLFQRREDAVQVAIGIAVGGGPDCDEYSLFASTDYYGEWIRTATTGSFR